MATLNNDMGKHEKVFKVGDKGIAEHIKSMLPSNQEIVIFCVGSEHYTGDLIGPYLGTMLKRYNCNYPVYGTLGDNAHAKTLLDMIDRIKSNHNNPFIIAIDACGGLPREVGEIVVLKGGFKPAIS